MKLEPMAHGEQPERHVGGIVERVARIAADHARLLRRLAQHERRLRRVSMRVLRVQEAERGRIARELHDSVGQSLTALKIQLELLEHAVELDREGFAARIAALRELAERSLEDVRGLSRLLRPPMLDDLGLVPTLRWLFRDVQKRTGIAVEFADSLPDAPLDPDAATLAYRIIQEALTNAAKHARTASVEIRLQATDTRLSFTIQDRGVGFDPKAVAAAGDAGVGVRGMRDRVQLFGGHFALHSAPGAGTRIEVEVPIGAAGEVLV